MAGALTAKRGRSPARTAATSSATSNATETCASDVDAAMCGVAMKFGIASRGLSPGGSFSNTSHAAPAIRPAWSAASSADSSMIPPRAVLIRRAVGFMRASSGVPMRLRLESTSGTCTVTKSACSSSSSRLTSATLNSSARSTETTGSNATTSISRPWARLATSDPTLPRPMTPRVLPRISVPMKFARVHSPRFTDASACGTERASEHRRAIVCSAAATMLPRGALTTRMPRRVAAGTSMLSTPTPARPTTRSFLPASMIGAVTRVSLRTTSASKSGMRRISSFSPSLLTTVTSPARRSRSRPSSARGSATRIFATSIPRSARGGGHALHGGGDRGEPASIRRRDVALLPRLLDRPDHLDDITLGDSAQVTHADHLARHLALAPGDHDAVLGVQKLAQRSHVEPTGWHGRSHRVGPVSMMREELEPECLQTGLRGPSQPRVPLVHVAQPLLLEHVQALLQRKRDRDCRRERGHAFVRPRLGFLPVEVETRRPRLRLLRPGALADADQRQSRWRHPAFLRTADRDVDAPRVGLDLDRADRADAIDHDKALGVARDPSELPQGVGEPGRGLVVGEQHHACLGVSLQDHGEIVGVDRLTPLELQARHVRAIGRCQRREALAEVAAQRDDDLVAGRNEVGHRRFEAARSRAGQQKEIVLGFEHALGPGCDLRQDRRELGTAVVDHGPVHAPDDPLWERGRSGDSQLGLECHGRAPLRGFGGLEILT